MLKLSYPPDGLSKDVELILVAAICRYASPVFMPVTHRYLLGADKAEKRPSLYDLLQEMQNFPSALRTDRTARTRKNYSRLFLEIQSDFLK